MESRLNMTQRLARTICASQFAWIAALLVICAVVITSRAANAQGTSGTLPEPMDTQELDGYAARLKLSPQQKQAAHLMHDQYKQEFRALRQGEIAEFLKEMRSMQGTMVMPKREAVEAIFKKVEHLTGKIAALDNRMFDQMQSVLTDEQLALMPRVRLARQRARYASQQMMWITGNRAVDLSELLMELKDIPAEQFQAADAIASQYETKLTAAIGKLYDTTAKMFMDMMDAMESMGLTEQNFENPETAEKFAEAMQQVWRDLTAKSMDAARAITELNHKTYRSLAGVLPAEQARVLRDRYYTAAYPEAGITFGYESALFNAAMKLPELNEEQKQQLTAARQELSQNLDPLIEEAISLIDKQRSESSPFEYNSEAAQEYQTKLQQLRESATSLRNSADEQIKTVLGPDLSRKATTAAMSEAGRTAGAALKAAMARSNAEVEAATTETVDAEEGTIELQHWSGDHFIPPAITRADLNEYTQILNATEDQQTILQQMHRTYLERYAKIKETEVAALTAATQSMWQVDPATQTAKAPKADVVDTIHRSRQAAMNAIRELDDSFFDDIEIVLEDSQHALLERVRLARDRAVHNRGHEMLWSWYDRSQEGRIDLVQLIRQQRLDSGTMSAIDAELQQYEKAAANVFRDRYEASLAMERAQTRWQIESMTAQQESEGNPMKLANRYQEIMGEPTKRVTEAKNEIVKLNRQTLDRILAAMPVDVAHSLRREYNRRAFPDIYNDALGVDEKLSSAQQLQDLPAEQRRRIEDLAAEYRLAYTNYCERMVELSTAAAAPVMMMGNFDAEGWRKWQEMQEAIAEVRFDRRELNLRTINAIRMALSEQDIARIGGLPDPASVEDHDIWD